MFELRVKGDADSFVGVLRAAGLECHATDEDVMRVFVPDERGAAVAVPARRRSTSVQVRHLRASVPTLEDVFAKAVGESDAVNCTCPFTTRAIDATRDSARRTAARGGSSRGRTWSTALQYRRVS